MPERGDLLLVPFPFTDLSTTKRRPVLALTSNDAYGDFVALPITSRPQADHAVPISAADLISGSLPVASWVRTNRVITLNTSLVVKVLARVSDRTVKVAVERLCAYIGNPDRG